MANKSAKKTESMTEEPVLTPYQQLHLDFEKALRLGLGENYFVPYGEGQYVDLNQTMQTGGLKEESILIKDLKELMRFFESIDSEDKMSKDIVHSILAPVGLIIEALITIIDSVIDILFHCPYGEADWHVSFTRLSLGLFMVVLAPIAPVAHLLNLFSRAFAKSTTTDKVEVLLESEKLFEPGLRCSSMEGLLLHLNEMDAHSEGIGKLTTPKERFDDINVREKLNELYPIKATIKRPGQAVEGKFRSYTGLFFGMPLTADEVQTPNKGMIIQA